MFMGSVFSVFNTPKLINILYLHLFDANIITLYSFSVCVFCALTRIWLFSISHIWCVCDVRTYNIKSLHQPISINTYLPKKKHIQTQEQLMNCCEYTYFCNTMSQGSRWKWCLISFVYHLYCLFVYVWLALALTLYHLMVLISSWTK